MGIEDYLVKRYKVVCDNCGEIQSGGQTAEDAKENARDNGWVFISGNGDWLCQGCKEERELSI